MIRVMNNVKLNCTLLALSCVFLLISISGCELPDKINLVTIVISERHGLTRSIEYIDYPFQLSQERNVDNFIVEDHQSGEIIPCQVIESKPANDTTKGIVRIIFPVKIEAKHTREFSLIMTDVQDPVNSDLRIYGDGFDLVIENKLYKADLSKNVLVEPQSHESGQIRELFIKMGFNQLLTNVEDRLHWAPNFKRPELEWYTTIAHWDSPRAYEVHEGPYLIQTYRKDMAPNHPEIQLTAVYQFYEDLPYFKFYSKMQMGQDVWLELLRNDEMTMDSMFTHLAFQRPNGKIEDLVFSERYELLQKQPIENNCPWICFYNCERGFAFGSIRIRYDNTNQFGRPSPLYREHTQIGEWLGGITYWNRRLIHDQLMFVPKGSCYIEETAYLVFRIGESDRFESIQNWAERLRHPLEVIVHYID